ncbi:MAG: GNAT family N-acetyltransferase [Meiothermus sp.]
MMLLLETPRLRLRPFAPDDVARVQELAGDARVADTTLNLSLPYPDGAAEGWIETHAELAEQGTHYVWAISDKVSGELTESISMSVVQKHSRGTLGYWLGVPFWNKGFMTEATGAVMDWGFDTLNLHRIEAACYTRNPGSYRVMEKCGMRCEGLFRDHYRKNDRFEDLYQYAILRTDRK